MVVIFLYVTPVETTNVDTAQLCYHIQSTFVATLRRREVIAKSKMNSSCSITQWTDGDILDLNIWRVTSIQSRLGDSYGNSLDE